MEALLKEDMTLGEKISKDKWPSYYVLKWGLRNLYKINIGPDWRMPYTLEFEGAGIAVVCLDLLPHKKYDRLFGYRTT